MTESFLLKAQGAQEIYSSVKDLPIIDFHNHICVADIKSNRKYDDITSLWLAPDPYKHRLMRICGVEEHFITGAATPFEKFEKYCEIFPTLAGNPVYDWSKMELSRIFGIDTLPSKETALHIWDEAREKLVSPEFSTNGILSRFRVEYQSPVVTLLEDLSGFDGIRTAPSLRGDELLSPTPAFKAELSKASGVNITDTADYLQAIEVMLDRLAAKGCRFADHSLDDGFFAKDKDGARRELLTRLGLAYAKRGFTLLLHIGAKRQTSPRLARLTGPAGGYAAAGGSFDLSALCDTLGKMEQEGGLPDTVIFPLNMNDQAPIAILQGSFSEDGTPSKVQLGPAWWWCDHAKGIENTLSCIASFGVLSQFIGMTTDSRSILSFVRHDYFRRLLCTWLDRQNETGEWELSQAQLAEIAQGICYGNAKRKISK